MSTNIIYMDGERIKDLAKMITNSLYASLDEVELQDNMLALGYLAAALGLAVNAHMLVLDDVTKANCLRLFIQYYNLSVDGSNATAIDK